MINSKYICSVCGELRINTPSNYSVCPNGHGRLNPSVPRTVRKIWLEMKRAESLPKASHVKRWTFRLAGSLWVRASKATAECEAAFNGKVIRLKKAANQ